MAGLYRKRQTGQHIKPWIVAAIISKNKNLKSKVVKVLCDRKSSAYGSTVKLVCDAELSIPASFSDDAVNNVLSELQASKTNWNSALLILHQFTVQLRQYSKDVGEFVLYVEKFNIWDLQPGYRAKYDVKYCMKHDQVWEIMMEEMRERNEREVLQSQSANTESIHLTQLLDEMAQPSIDEMAQPSIEEKAQPSIEEIAESSIEEKAQPSIEENAQPSIEKIAQPSIVENVQPSIEKNSKHSISLSPLLLQPSQIDRHTVNLTQSLMEKLMLPYTVDEFLIPASQAATLEHIQEWCPDYRPPASTEHDIDSMSVCGVEQFDVCVAGTLSSEHSVDVCDAGTLSSEHSVDVCDAGTLSSEHSGSKPQAAAHAAIEVSQEETGQDINYLGISVTPPRQIGIPPWQIGIPPRQIGIPPEETGIPPGETGIPCKETELKQVVTTNKCAAPIQTLFQNIDADSQSQAASSQWQEELESVRFSFEEYMCTTNTQRSLDTRSLRSHSRHVDDMCTSKTQESLNSGSPESHCRQSDDLCTPVAPRRTPKSCSTAVEDSLVLNKHGSLIIGSPDAHSTQEGDSYAYNTQESINIGSPEAHSTQVDELIGKQPRKSDCTFLALSSENSELLVTSGSSVIVGQQDHAVPVEHETADYDESSILTENSYDLRPTDNCEHLPAAINHDTPVLVKMENVEPDYEEINRSQRLKLTSESCLSDVDKYTMVEYYSYSQEGSSPEQNWNNVMLRLADKKKKLEALKYVAERLSIGFNVPNKSTENLTGQDTRLESCNSGDKDCETIKMCIKEISGNKLVVSNKDANTLRGTGNWESKESENMTETNLMRCELSESNKSVEQKQTVQFRVIREPEKTVHVEENTDSLAICKDFVDESGETSDVDHIQQKTVESSSTGYPVSDLSLRESFQESNSCLLPSDNILDSTDLAEIDRLHCEMIADAIQTGAVGECNDADHINLGDIDTLRQSEEKTNWFSQELNLLAKNMLTKLSCQRQHQIREGNSLAPTYFDTEYGSKRRSKRLRAKVFLAREKDCPRNVRNFTETFVHGKDSISADANALQGNRETGSSKKKAFIIESFMKLKETRQNNSGKEINTRNKKIVLGENGKEKWDNEIDADCKNTTNAEKSDEPILCNQQNKKHDSEQIVGKKTVDEVSDCLDQNTAMTLPCSENKHLSKNRKAEEIAGACGFSEINVVQSTNTKQKQSDTVKDGAIGPDLRIALDRCELTKKVKGKERGTDCGFHSQKFTLKEPDDIENSRCPRLLRQRFGGRVKTPLKKVVSTKLTVAVEETLDDMENLPLSQLKKMIESKRSRVGVEDADLTLDKADSISEASSKGLSKQIVGKSGSSEKANIVQNASPKKLAKMEIGKGTNNMRIEIVTDSSTDNSCNYKSSRVTTFKRNRVKHKKQGAIVHGTGVNKIKITELAQSENSDGEERNMHYVLSDNKNLTKSETGRKLAIEANEEAIGNEASVIRQKFKTLSSSKLAANTVTVDTNTADKNQASVEATVTRQTLRECIPAHSWENHMVKSTEKDQQISGDENVLNLNGEQSNQTSDKVILSSLLSEQSTQPFDVCEYPETQEFSPKLSETHMEISMSETEKRFNKPTIEMNLSGDADKLKSGSLQHYTTSQLCDPEEGSVEIFPVNKNFTKLTRKAEPLNLTTKFWSVQKLAEPTFKVKSVNRQGIQRKRKIECGTIDLVSTYKKQKISEKEPNIEIVVTPGDKIVIPRNKQDDERKKDGLMLVDSCDSNLDFNVCQTKSPYKKAMTTYRHGIPNKVVHKGENKSPTKKPKMLYMENSAKNLEREVNKGEKGKMELVNEVILADKAKKHVKSSEPRKIHNDGHCYGKNSSDKKLKTGIEKTNKRKSSLSSNQNSQKSEISADNIRNTISESVNRLRCEINKSNVASLRCEINKSNVASLKQGISKQHEKQSKTMEYASVINDHHNRGSDSYKELRMGNIDGTLKLFTDSQNMKKKKLHILKNIGAVSTEFLVPGNLKLDTAGAKKQRKDHGRSKLKRDSKLFGNENAGKYRELNESTLKKSFGVIPRDLNIRRNTLQMAKQEDKKLFAVKEAGAGRLSVDKELFVQEWLMNVKKTRGPGTKDKIGETESTETLHELSPQEMLTPDDSLPSYQPVSKPHPCNNEHQSGEDLCGFDALLVGEQPGEDNSDTESSGWESNVSDKPMSAAARYIMKFKKAVMESRKTEMLAFKSDMRNKTENYTKIYNKH